MRKASLFIFLFISIFLLSEFPVDASRGISVISDLSHKSGKLGAYRALIIGINDYKDPKIPDLETAVSDAKAMAELLRERYDFKVKLLLNREATREAIYRALRSLASSTKPDESVLIYYAGHGDLDRTYDDGWWIPVDAKGGDPITYLDNVQVQKSMRSMKARHVLLISDSCYSGTLFGQARAMPQVIDDKYYLNLYNEKSRWGITSGNKTPVSDIGTGGHSVFAYQLLKELRESDKPYISTQEIYTRIAPIISNNSEQTPLCRPILNTGDQGGEFVFVTAIQKPVLEDEKTTPTVPKIQQSVIDKDMLFWQSILNSDNPALFEAYLDKFPNGTFVTLAKIKIEEFSKDTPQKEEDTTEPKAKASAVLKVPEVKVKKENKKLAYIPKTSAFPKMLLRKTPEEDLKEEKIKAMVLKYNFFDSILNPYGSFNNDFIDDQNSGTVTDKRTGLMWQKSGLLHPVRKIYALGYVRKLNRNYFAGHQGWRLPTIDEIASLLSKNTIDGLHIDTVFDRKQKQCWSSDKRENPNIGHRHEGWIINFIKGKITTARWSERFSAIQGGWEKGFNTDNYVRAVRSVK